MSQGPWAGSNLALHVAEDVDSVLTNRRLLAAGFGAADVAFPEQVHGSEVSVVARIPHPGDPLTRGGAPGVDALVTAVAGQPIAVLVADCMPVLLADPVNRVVGAAHAGRRGLTGGVLQSTVAAMLELGAEPERIGAVVGPAICGRCYEVPAEMRDEVDAVVRGAAAKTRAGTPALDLPHGAVSILRGLGLGRVDDLGICTLEDERFYSYRRDRETGRFAGVVMLACDG